MTLSGENEDITSDISSLAKIGADTFSAVLSFKVFIQSIFFIVSTMNLIE